MLCFDQESVEKISSLDLKNATVIPIQKLEFGDEKLINAKRTRTKLEYYYTCGPSLPLFILNKFQEVDLITYLDADLFFFSDPTPLFGEFEGYSIGITYHNFPEYRRIPETGKFNVGWLSFRRDENAYACLKWWREKCIEWCCERFENGKYADQLYLEEWPILFRDVKIFNHKGANVAAWNICDYELTERNGLVIVSGYPLIFYHFHGFKKISNYIYNTNLGLTFRSPTRILKYFVFKPYIDMLNTYSQDSNPTATIRRKRIRPRWLQLIRSFLRLIIGLIFRQYVIVYKEKIY